MFLPHMFHQTDLAQIASITLVTDIIFSMKQIKMQAWESIFGQKINELRKDELNQLRLVFEIHLESDWWTNKNLVFENR